MKNIDFNIEDKDHFTPLGLSLFENKEEIARIILEKERVNVNLGKGVSGAPIHIAVNKVMYNIVKKLL